MGVNRFLKVCAILLTVALCASEAAVYEAWRKPVDAQIPMTPKAVVSNDFWVLLPGSYQLELVFDRTSPSADNTLKSVLGDFACWDIKNDSPCGEHLPYAIAWEVLSGDHVLASGIGNERVRGGHLGRTWGRQLGLFQLPAGHLTLRAISERPLPELASLNPRLVMSGGNGTVKSVQSSFVGYVWILWMLGRALLWYVAGTLWIAVWLLWFRSRDSRQGESGVSA